MYNFLLNCDSIIDFIKFEVIQDKLFFMVNTVLKEAISNIRISDLLRSHVSDPSVCK